MHLRIAAVVSQFCTPWVQLCIDYAADWCEICEEDVRLEASDKKFEL